jgi:hypothetical protein
MGTNMIFVYFNFPLSLKNAKTILNSQATGKEELGQILPLGYRLPIPDHSETSKYQDLPSPNTLSQKR